MTRERASTASRSKTKPPAAPKKKARGTKRAVDREPYHHGDLRRALIEAGLELLPSCGFERLTLKAIADRVGVSHTAPYRHFATMNDLLAAMREAGFVRFATVRGEALVAEYACPREAFLETGWTVARFALENRELHRLMFAGPLSEQLEDLSRSGPETSFGKFLRAIRNWQKVGLMREGPTIELALAIWATTHGLVTLALAGWLPTDPEQLRPFVDATHARLLEGLAPDTAQRTWPDLSKKLAADTSAARPVDPPRRAKRTEARAHAKH